MAKSRQAANQRRAQHVVTVKLSAPLYARIGSIAKKRNASKSHVIRDAIEAGVSAAADQEDSSFYALTASLAGSATGPRDLSTNASHMRDFGK